MTKYAKWLFDGPHFTLLSKLKYSECLFRLKKNIDRPSNWSIIFGDTMFGNADFVGNVSDGSFSFHRKCFKRGSKPIFCGKLFDTKIGTIIEGGFQTDSFAKAVGAAIISFLMLFLILFSIGSINEIGNDPILLSVTLLLLVILIGLLAFIILGKATKKSDEISYTKFLLEILEAELIERKE